MGKIQSFLDLMGAHQSKEELVYQQVNYGNIEGIKSLRREGAGLEVSNFSRFLGFLPLFQ